MDVFRMGMKDLMRRVFSGAAVWLFALLATGSVLPTVAADSANQATFSTAAEAGRALFMAVSQHDEAALTRILASGNELLQSDDALQDRLDREQFAQKYEQMHRFTRAGDGVALLYVGAENWPFPMPLVAENGQWRFDADAGREEIRLRRIGENEINAIALCQDLAARAGYSQTAKSNPDALTAALKNAENGDPGGPVRGYYFRTVRGPGGSVTIIAYPAEYRSSGVMTFIVNADGVVRQKDLGWDTAKAARAISGATDATWLDAS